MKTSETKLEQEVAELRQQVAALIAERDQPADVQSALANLTRRIEAVDPEMRLRRIQERTDEMTRKFDEAILAPYRDVLAGAKGFAVSVMEPQRQTRSDMPALPKPAPGLTRFVFVGEHDGPEIAIARYEKLMAIHSPKSFGLSKYMDGVYPHAVECTSEEAEPVRRRCLELIADTADPGKINLLMIAAGERIINSRNPKTEVDALGVS